MKRHLCLFSGTHSFGRVSSKLGFTVTSLDMIRDDKSPFDSNYKSNNHIKADIMTWKYDDYPPGYFKVITASPVCTYWSRIRYSRIGQYSKELDRIFTKTDLLNDIENKGKPMVRRLFDIIFYFKPQYWIIENPYSSGMWKYIDTLTFPHNAKNYVTDYCQYGFMYPKRTKFITNFGNDDLVLKKCWRDTCPVIKRYGQHDTCEHKSRLIKYRIPLGIIAQFFKYIK